MERGTREQNIKRIIYLEDRINQCQRCPRLIKCMRKPSFGKGDLEPDVMMIFESENNITTDMDQVIAMRDMIKERFDTDRVYHSFLVRCQPKACTARESSSCIIEGKYLDKDYVCLLTNQVCDGIPIKASTTEIMNCLPFMLEEINILRPYYVILFGEIVSSYILKSCGVYDIHDGQRSYKYNGITLITTVDEMSFNAEAAASIGPA
ncbi:MAG TPA: hypothetical protein GX404_06185 [Syntrophomonadaceae bacterium]|nr:hypothetical protein [Syntrophomonadaceae bacterium]